MPDRSKFTKVGDPFDRTMREYPVLSVVKLREPAAKSLEKTTAPAEFSICTETVPLPVFDHVMDASPPAVVPNVTSPCSLIEYVTRSEKE